MEAETSLICNLAVEKLRPEGILGAFIEKESETGKWTMKKVRFWLKRRRLNLQGE